MSQRPTPEEVICQMSIAELQELLSDLSMDASTTSARTLQRLVRELQDFEAAIETIAGPATMKKAA